MMLLKKTFYGELVKKVHTVNSDKQNREEKIENVDKKIPNTSKFIVTQDLADDLDDRIIKDLCK